MQQRPIGGDGDSLLPPETAAVASNNNCPAIHMIEKNSAGRV
jgi:hypothetical protein